MGASATAADLRRLADRAEANGVRILIEPISGEHYATSASKANVLYRLTHWSCTCAGFVAWQRCQHHSLLLSQLGYLPGPDPEPGAPAPLVALPVARPCTDCRGRGVARVEAAGELRRVPCSGCGGGGGVPADELAEAA